jgi:hypothetical protein
MLIQQREMGYMIIPVEGSDKSVIMKLEMFCELPKTDKLETVSCHLQNRCD